MRERRSVTVSNSQMKIDSPKVQQVQKQRSFGSISSLLGKSLSIYSIIYPYLINNSVSIYTLAFSCGKACNYCILFWLPDFLEATIGFDAKTVI